MWDLIRTITAADNFANHLCHIRPCHMSFTPGSHLVNGSLVNSDFARELDPARARALYAVQAPGADALAIGRTTAAVWRAKPCWYEVSTDDRTISPELERFLAKRMKATTIELTSSHVSLLSHPREVADLILSAAGHNG
jgi:hypothetical protein